MKTLLKIYICLMLVSLTGRELFCQNARINSLAGLSLSIPDKDNSLNLYDFGNNPAWLSEDEITSRTEFNSGYNYTHGDYRRYFSAASVSNYNAEFVKINNLGRAGVFYGSAGYSYELRNEYNKSIQYSPYSGEAFFLSDASSGKFSYSGPKVNVQYSYKLFPDILLGASIDYRVLDGVKKEYSMPHTTLRSINLSGGIAVKVTNRINLGLLYNYYDSQEAIESKSNGLSEVEIFIFRGEKYSLKKIGTIVNEKIKKNENSFGLQLFYNPVDKLEAAFAGNYSVTGSRLLLEGSQNIDYEDAFANFDFLSIDFRLRYFLNEFTFGLQAAGSQNKSWTRNSVRDLLIWKWKLSENVLGLGITWKKPDSKWLVTGEYKLNKITADSLKFIDNRFANFIAINHIAGIGTEYYLGNDLTLRAGWRYSSYSYDLLIGGRHVANNLIALGGSFKLFNYPFDLSLSYEKSVLKNSGMANKILLNLSIRDFAI